MPEIYLHGCFVAVEDVTQGQVLDPCNCSSYYRVITLPASKTRLVCPENQLWNLQTNTCQPQKTVLNNKLCNRATPWDRCLHTTDTNKRNIRSKCIKLGSFNQSIADMYVDERGTGGLGLPDNVQMANLELVLAAMVAGSLITILLIAIILTFCGVPSLDFLSCRLPWQTKGKTKTVVKKTRVSKKTVTSREIVREGDDVSVVYEDIEDEQDISISQGYRAMGTEGPGKPARAASQPGKGPLPVPPKKQPSPTIIRAHQTTHTSQVTTSSRPLPNPLFGKPKTKDGASAAADNETMVTLKVTPNALRLAPKPAGSTPKVPQKVLKSAQVPPDKKKPLRPVVPEKLGPKASSASYIHPINNKF